MSFAGPAFQNAVVGIYERLSNLPISALLAHRRERRTEGAVGSLIAVPEDAKVSEVMGLLRNEGILAVPTYRALEDVGSREYTGIVSIYDILAFTVFRKAFDEELPKDEEKLKAIVESLLDDQEAYFGTPVKAELSSYSDHVFSLTSLQNPSIKVKDIVGASREGKESWSLNSSMPLSSLLQLFTAGAYHRALVIDDEALRAETAGPNDGPGATAPPEGVFTTLVTQSDLLFFVADSNLVSKTDLEVISGLPARELDALSSRRAFHDPGLDDMAAAAANEGSRVVTVPDTATAFQAFR
ncbi:hypothetical protein HKX48_005622 [Thoreauomyces humboldtii]|nr:hypothetical protein HKX48_005622 [Thoreauomyces humboldtii]